MGQALGAQDIKKVALPDIEYIWGPTNVIYGSEHRYYALPYIPTPPGNYEFGVSPTDAATVTYNPSNNYADVKFNGNPSYRSFHVYGCIRYFTGGMGNELGLRVNVSKDLYSVSSSNGAISIKADEGAAKQASYKLVDVFKGKVIEQGQFSGGSADIFPKAAKGIYVLNIEDEDGQESHKIVID